MIGKTISHYRVIEKIGEGGMGVVYLAEHSLLGRRVAIKTLIVGGAGNQHFRSRFLREAQAVSKLSHPNIANIYDYGETDDGQPYIVMELVEGKTLNEVMRAETLTIARAIDVVTQVAQALSEAHRHGIVHRDVKPSNIAINERGIVKVLDFGLAKHAPSAAANAESNHSSAVHTQTREGVIVGTPLYLSPEQALGLEVDARSDLFSLGSVLYECIAGRPPFTGKSDIDICAKVIRDDPPPPSEFNNNVSADFDRLSLKALSKKPEARFQTAAEMIAGLETAVGAIDRHSSNQAVTRHVDFRPRARSTSALATLSDIFKRPRLSIGYALGAGVALLAGIVIFSYLSRATLPPPSPEAQRWYEIGTNDLREGTYFKAIRPFEQAIAIDPNFVLAHARLAETWAELDYTDRAQVETLRVDSLVPNRAALSEVDALYLDSIRALVTRDIPAAINANRRIVQLKPKDPAAYTDLARALEKNDQVDEAIGAYQTALSLNSQHAAPALRLGILYSRKQDESLANTHFDKADALFQTLGDFEGRAEVLYERGVFLKSISRFPEAEDQFQKALDFSRTSNNRSQQVSSMLALGSVWSLTGKTDPARKMAADAVGIAQADGTDNLAAQGLIDLGLAYLVRRAYGDSEQTIKQALDIARRNKSARNQARALLALAQLYLQQETRVDESIEYLKSAKVFFEKGDYQAEVSQCTLFFGRAKLLKGDDDGALQDFQRVVSVAKRIYDLSDLANAYVLIGNVLRDRENYPEALANFEESYKLFGQLNIPLSAAYMIIDQAKMYWRLGRYADAERVLSEIPKVLDRLDSDYRDVIMAREALVRAEIAASRLIYAEAKSKAEQALRLAGPIANYTAVEAKSVLAVALVHLNERERGLQISHDAVAMADQITDARLKSRAMLVEAEALLENNKPKEALTEALDCQQRFAKSGQLESEWRAWVIAARASEKLKQSDATASQFSQANQIIEKLSQTWGDAFRGYAMRPDVKTSLARFAKQNSI